MKRTTVYHKSLILALGCSVTLTSCHYVNQAYRETFDLPAADTQPSTSDQQGAVGGEWEQIESGDLEFDHSEEQAGQDEEEVTEIVEPAPVINLLEEPEQLLKAKESLQALFPEKSLQIYPPHIYFEDDRIRLQLLDPDIPGNIDWYYYHTADSAWHKEEPVKTSVHIKRIPIALDAIPFEVAQVVYEQLKVKSEEIEGAELPTTVYFTINRKPWYWHTDIRGSRSDYAFETDVNGKEKSFKRR